MENIHEQTPHQKAAFFDVDGTLTTEHLWKGLMHYFKANNLKQNTHKWFISTHYPLYFIRKAGLISESSFRRIWAGDLAWYFKGMSPNQTEKIWDWVVGEFMQPYWREDSLELLQTHLSKNDLVILVSSGPQPLISRVGRELGTQHAIGTKLEIQNGIFTGRSLKPVCINEFKASMAKSYLSDNKIKVDFSHSYAYADSTGDIQLLEMVGKPTAVYPDEGLLPIAKQRGWQIFPDKFAKA